MIDWFTSDWHFFHNRIIDYCNRPYRDINEMHKEIIYKHNSVVKPGDNVYVLGDCAFLGSERIFKLKPLLDKMNGTKHLIMGNHDDAKPFTYEKIGFTTVHTALVICDGKVILRHDPAAANVMPDKLWLVGHVHNVFHYTIEPIKCFNVGVDVNNFYPVNLKQIEETMDIKI